MAARARTAFALAAISGGLLILTWVLAVRFPVGQRVDQAIFKGFLDLGNPRTYSVAAFIAKLCDPIPWVFFAGVPVAVALSRRRPRVALTVATILIGANATTQLLKPLLAAPRAHGLLGSASHVLAGSWPSGHATAAMSLALGSVLAAPARWRGLVAAIGAAFSVTVSYSFLTLGWHYPSDVLGGFLIAAAWGLAGAGVLLVLEAHRSRSGTTPGRESVARALIPSAVALAAGLGLAGLVVLARPHEVLVYARAHQSFVVGAAAIAGLSLLLATAVSFAVRR